MRRGGRLPGNQAEVVFSDIAVEQLDTHTPAERESVLSEIVSLCENPAGKHPLSGPLAGWNTVEVLAGRRRVIYRSGTTKGTGLIEVLCTGPRSDNEVYDMVRALVDSGLLSDKEVTDLWLTIALLDIVAEDVGLDGWDHQPAPAPPGMQRAAVVAGLIDSETAAVLSQGELAAAMEHGWNAATGEPDPEAALAAALERARSRVSRGGRDIPAERRADRCGQWMPRAERPCSRRRGHPGPHRAR